MREKMMPESPAVSTATPTPDYVNILLHGLFFMDFQTDGLVISTPDVMGHMIKTGCKGLISDLTHDVDWVVNNRPLKPGTMRSFSGRPQIFQFAKSTVGYLTGPYKARIALPFPAEIIPLRLGQLSDFKYKNAGSGGIGDQIYQNCNAAGKNKDIALITCLRYERNVLQPNGKTITYSFYAEHLMPSGQDTNDALFSSQVLFEHRAAFDLQIDEKATAPDVNPQDEPSYAITKEDEYTLLEIQANRAATRGPSVMNCMQFGLI